MTHKLPQITHSHNTQKDCNYFTSKNYLTLPKQVMMSFVNKVKFIVNVIDVTDQCSN